MMPDYNAANIGPPSGWTPTGTGNQASTPASYATAPAAAPGSLPPWMNGQLPQGPPQGMPSWMNQFAHVGNAPPQGYVPQATGVQGSGLNGAPPNLSGPPQGMPAWMNGQVPSGPPQMPSWANGQIPPPPGPLPPGAPGAAPAGMSPQMAAQIAAAGRPPSAPPLPPGYAGPPVNFAAGGRPPAQWAAGTPAGSGVGQVGATKPNWVAYPHTGYPGGG